MAQLRGISTSKEPRSKSTHKLFHGFHTEPTVFPPHADTCNLTGHTCSGTSDVAQTRNRPKVLSFYSKIHSNTLMTVYNSNMSCTVVCEFKNLARRDVARIGSKAATAYNRHSPVTFRKAVQTAKVPFAPASNLCPGSYDSLISTVCH